MHVVLAYKNFAANRAISHIGLGVTALNTAKSLRDAGINTDVWPITSAAELRTGLRKTPASHVVISAPWIPTTELALLCAEFGKRNSPSPVTPIWDFCRRIRAPCGWCGKGWNCGAPTGTSG